MTDRMVKAIAEILSNRYGIKVEVTYGTGVIAPVLRPGEVLCKTRG